MSEERVFNPLGKFVVFVVLISIIGAILYSGKKAVDLIPKECKKAVDLSPKECKICNGEGKIVCTNCGGKGFTIKDTDCKKCSAGQAGIGKCTQCGGDGKVWIFLTCKACKGTGKCPFCNGDKHGNIHTKVPCPKCQGKGKIKCPNCRGTGKIQLKDQPVKNLAR